MKYTWSVFTKPWKTQSVHELGQLISGLGFDGIEFPLRPGFQAEPQNAGQDLPRLASVLAEYGVKITSVASDTTETVFAACQAAGVPVIRIMAPADTSVNWMQAMDQKKRALERLLPLCEKYSVQVGVQQHYGYGVSGTMELRYLLRDLDPRYIGAVWDAAHSALAGELPGQALDIIWDKLILVNLKMAYYRRTNGPESPQAVFEPYFTTAQHGQASWTDTRDYLIQHGYSGVICMPAEYTDIEHTREYIAADLKYAKSLFGEE